MMGEIRKRKMVMSNSVGNVDIAHAYSHSVKVSHKININICKPFNKNIYLQAAKHVVACILYPKHQHGVAKCWDIGI